MARARSGQGQPGIYARLLGNWGLSVAGLPCVVADEEERRCPLRPLAEELKRVATGAAARDRNGRR
jgi:hypothetical protein